MRKLLIASVSFLSLTACIATHTGTISSTSIDEPVRYEDIAYGVSYSTRYFGFGGISQDALILEAKRNMIANRPLKANEEYANYTIDFKNTYWPFYFQTKATISADVIRFTSDTTNSPYSDNYLNKIKVKSISNDLFSIGDTIYDSKFVIGTIILFDGANKVRVLYKTKADKIRTKIISIKDIYSKSRSHNGFKIGDWFATPIVSQENQSQKVGKIIALGLNSVILSVNNKSWEIVPYK